MQQIICQTCHDTGYLSCDETDTDGNIQRGVGRVRCHVCNPKEDDDGDSNLQEN